MVESFKILMGAAALYLIITAQGLFFLSRFKLRFELAVPISLMIDMFILLFSGLVFSNLLIGVYAVIVLSAAGLAAAVICEKSRLRDFLRVFCSAGFVVFTVGYAFSWIVSLSQVPHAWDDYGHWLPFVKQMVTYNKLYSDPDVYLMKQWYYTPAVSILQYLSCMLVGGFSECACYSMSTLIMFASILPVMKWFEPKSVKVRVFSTAIVFFSLYVVAREDLDGFFLGFRSVYVDVNLSAVTCLLLCWIVFEKEAKTKCFFLGIIAAFLTVMKVTGIMFALLGAGTYFLMVTFEVIVSRRKIAASGEGDKAFPQKRLSGFMKILLALIPIIASAAVYIAWNSQTRPEIEYGSVIGLGSDGFIMSVNKYGQGLTLRTFQITWDWLRTYFYYFFQKSINDGATILVTSSVFVLLFWGAIYINFHINPKIEKPKIIIWGLCITGGLFVYLLALGISFYSFYENMDTMTSYKRYLSSYMGIFVSLFVVIWLHTYLCDIKLERKRKIVLSMITVVILAAMIPKEIIPAVLGTSESDSYKEYYNKMEQWGQNISTQLLGESEKDPKVFLVKTGHGGPDTPSLAADVAMPSYFMLPLRLQDFSQYRYDPDSALPFYTKEEWDKILSDYGFTNVVIANYTIPSLGWGVPSDTQRLEEFYHMIDVPPEELSYDEPLTFEVYQDENGHSRLKAMLIETPVN